MLEAEAKWAQQEKQMILDEAKNHHQKQAAIEAEKQLVDNEKKAIHAEAKTARYESLF